MVLIMIGSQDENNTYHVIKNRLQQSWHKIHEKRSLVQVASLRSKLFQIAMSFPSHKTSFFSIPSNHSKSSIIVSKYLKRCSHYCALLGSKNPF